MRQYQFELWTDCNSKCDFCFLGYKNGIKSNEIKIENLKKTIATIQQEHFLDNLDCLSFIGGEFFQGQLKNPEVKKLFMELMMLCSNYLDEGKLQEIWLNCTLNIGTQEDLYEALSYFKDKSKIWILTSYDTIGRFHTPKMEQIWKDNVKKIRDTFPEIKINITSILTGDFIEKYIAEDLDLMLFARQINASQFLKPTCSISRPDGKSFTKEETNKFLPNFFTTRKKFRQFLYTYASRESEDMYDKLFSMNLRATYLSVLRDEKVIERLKNNYMVQNLTNLADKDISPCGLHSDEYNIYLDDPNGCCVCDKEEIWKLYKGIE